MPSLHKVFILRQDQHTEGVIAFIRANAGAMALAGTPLAVTVTEAKSKRSLDQNARLHALLTDIAGHAWVNGKQFSMEVWKEHFRRMFIGTDEVTLPNGERIEQGISTTTLDVAAFSEFMMKIEEYAQDYLAVELHVG